jgi:hypothetical protein
MRARLVVLLLGLPLVAWMLFAFLGTTLSSHVSSKFGAQILALGDGKFDNAQRFVEKRMEDAVIVLTTACVLILACRFVMELSARRFRPPVRWVIQGWAAFVCLNVLVAVASQTALFWCALYSGKDNVQNYTQWRIKETLMRENEAPSRAVLLGSSQVRTQMDSKALNARLGNDIWTTELHFPGSTPFDMVLCLEHLPKSRLKYVITYVSEPNFYSQGDNGRLMYFFGISDLPAYWRLEPWRPAADTFLVSGILGDVFPLYQIWESVQARAQSLLRRPVDEKQKNYDASLEKDLSQRAHRIGKTFAIGPFSESQKNAFSLFATKCKTLGARLIVCDGQVNPVLAHSMDPSLREDMNGFLRTLAATDPNILLLTESEMPAQTESDYEDLTHVNLRARARFSQFMADVLEPLDKSRARMARPPETQQ